jgi:hypothetical protein
MDAAMPLHPEHDYGPSPLREDVYKKIAELCTKVPKPRSTSPLEKCTSVLHIWGYLGEGNIKIKKYFR